MFGKEQVQNGTFTQEYYPVKREGIEYTATHNVTDTLLVNKPPSGAPRLGTGY